jgi:hypothetical protein
VRGGAHDAALRAVRQAQASQQHRFGDSASAEPAHPCGGSTVERDLVLARVLLAAHLPDARTQLDAAGARLQALLKNHVPAEFHANFLHRNPANGALLTLLRALN